MCVECNEPCTPYTLCTHCRRGCERGCQKRERVWEKVHSGTQKVHMSEEADVWGVCDRVRFSQQLTAPFQYRMSLLLSIRFTSCAICYELK